MSRYLKIDFLVTVYIPHIVLATPIPVLPIFLRESILDVYSVSTAPNLRNVSLKSWNSVKGKARGNL